MKVNVLHYLIKSSETQYNLGIYNQSLIDAIESGDFGQEEIFLVKASKFTNLPHDLESDSFVYVEDYTLGTLCGGDNVDNISPHAGIERSSQIRYYCGKKLGLIDVQEDRTCHYIVYVSIPALCHHPLFQMEKQTSVGQVTKCLPA